MRPLSGVPARPEVELALLCARTGMTPPAVERARQLLAAGVDATRLFRFARRHKIVSLVYRGLTRAPGLDAPTSLMEPLRSFHLTNAAQCQYLVRQLVEVLEVLAARGIPAVTLKGPELAQRAYGDLAMRRFTDLDLLVRPQDRRPAERALESLGYRFLARGKDAFETNEAGQEEFARKGVMIELHWRLAPWHAAFPLEGRIWDRLADVDLDGARVACLGVEDTVLNLAFHGYKHLWGEVSEVADLAEFARRNPEADWVRVLAEARNLGIRRMLLTGFRLGRDLLAAPPPRPLAGKLADDGMAVHLARRIQQRTLAGEDQEPGPVRRALFHFRGRERLRDRLWFCLWRLRLAALPNAADQAWTPLPRPLRFLRFLLRPARLAATYALGRGRRVSPAPPRA